VTRAELLEVVYRFYPQELCPDSPGYDETPQRRRLVAAAQRGAAEHPVWKAMLRRLATRYGFHDHSLHILGGNVDAAYTDELRVRGREQEDAALRREHGWRLRFGCSVSLLGPYYVVRHTGSPGEDPAEVAREIEATYAGYQTIPPEIGDVVVPDVALDTRGFGEVTIANCLLSTHWAAEEGSGPAGASSGR
jgi:hypothetical protein